MSTNLLVASTAPRGSGGLGTAAAEMADGAEAHGASVTYHGPQPATRRQKLAGGRPFRRLFGMAAARRLAARGVRESVPAEGWDLFYGTPECVPLHLGTGVKAIYQATRFPAREWEALQRAERKTGGRGDMSTAERRIRERELREVDLIHVTTEAVRDEFLEAGFPEGKLVHAYPGVDLELNRPAEKVGPPRVAFIGPLSLRKGVDLAAAVADRLGDAAVVEAVGGPTCPWSRRVAAHARFEQGHSAAETLARSHVLILPSRSDGFSYVVLEALASGAVPIVTPEVGAAEVVERLDSRLVVSETEFADAAVELIETLDLEDLGRRARELAQDFDRRKAAPAIAEALLARLSPEEAAVRDR